MSAQDLGGRGPDNVDDSSWDIDGPGSRPPTRYEQLDLFELTDAGMRTARQAEAAEGESVEAWLDHAEVLYEARGRMRGNKAFGEWWEGLDVSYKSAWRAVLIRAGARIKRDGARPSYSDCKTDGRFNLEAWANDEDTPADSDHGAGDEWYTPRWIFDGLGLRFDLDVCAPFDLTHVNTPADRFYTPADDGLIQPWTGLVWCNPPYSAAAPWAERMIDHDNGIMLSHVPVNGIWALDVWDACTALRLFQTIEFVRPDGTLERPYWWLQLAAFGDVAANALEAMTVDIDIAARNRSSRLIRWDAA